MIISSLRKFFFAALIVSFSAMSFAQVTVRVMAYNVLNYSSTNQNKSRYADFRTIMAHFDPDLIIISELDDAAGAQLLLDSGLNAFGGATYARANFVDGPDSDNMLFYNTAKAGLLSQAQVSTSLRDISHYKLYIKIGSTDSAYLNLFSGHLKASNSTADANDRYLESLALCNYLSAIPQTENVIFGGDFNLYSNMEPAWQLLTGSNCSHTFYDPINMAGAWNNNSIYTAIHTQSTRASTMAGCCGGSTGGLDDRFDFLLGTAPVINGTARLKYISGTYSSGGNDANHFNKAITEAPTNTAVPANVATALFNMSDHLPVMMDLEAGLTIGIKEQANSEALRVQACVNEGLKTACIYTKHETSALVSISDIGGREIGDFTINLKAGFNYLKSEQLPSVSGTFIIKVKTHERFASCVLGK